MSAKAQNSWTGTAKPAIQEETNKPKEELAPIEFQKLTASDDVKLLKIAVTGRPKTGKTRFALSCPSPIYVIETEPGLKPLCKLFQKKKSIT